MRKEIKEHLKEIKEILNKNYTTKEINDIIKVLDGTYKNSILKNGRN